MDTINVFFIALSAVSIAYSVVGIIRKRRLPLLNELFFIFVCLCVMFVFIFPDSLRWFEATFQIQYAIHFILYLSIFVIFLMLLNIYRKLEKTRVDVTSLVREIAYLNEKLDQKRK